ncbi:hypothetical protein BJ508DRAFT_91978 [Ascobolus immersus RN42]|uniref:Uncharacterized protein n=1 Tax=Ascobolus immersus RN42 TaxID=1160509 RepID=A0A3N4HEW3_ASCIM|nr:hypothetical protein BJ508DRAFT_91978 [Ascobolus immersus RN42]
MTSTSSGRIARLPQLFHTKSHTGRSSTLDHKQNHKYNRSISYSTTPLRKLHLSISYKHCLHHSTPQTPQPRPSRFPPTSNRPVLSHV